MPHEMLPALASTSPPLPAIAGSDLVSAWLDGRKASTIHGYQKDLDHFTRTIGTTLDAFLELLPGHANGVVLAYRAEQLGRGLSSATIARRLAAVRSVVKIARTLGRITWTIEVGSPRHEDRRDMSGPDDADRKKIVKALKALGDTTQAKRDRALYSLLFTMILRRAEVVALDLADVDFAGGMVAVRGKGHREKQLRPMPPNTSSALGEWVVARGRHEGPLFTRTDRPSFERLTGEAVRLAMATVGQAAGLTKSLRPHGLRHAGITKLRSLGESDRDVMALSRHKNPQMLCRYDDSRAQGAKKMAAKLDTELK